MPKKRSRKNKKYQLELLADNATAWVGSVESLIFHTFLFIGAFILGLLGVNWDRVLLTLTTIVSLEAIYLAIFIQMSVNRNTKSLTEIEKDVDEIQHDVDEIEKDVDDIQDDVVEITELERLDDKAENEHALALKAINEQINKLAQAINELKK